ncbi:MAG: alkaline phosphatase PhoX, partial [Pseudomonadota bacterium]
MDYSENFSTNPTASTSATMSRLIDTRLSRRGVLKGLGASLMAPMAACASLDNAVIEPGTSGADVLSFNFEEITRGVDGIHHAPAGYEVDILIKWGDALFPNAAPYDPEAQSRDAQLQQFGYNCDYVGFYPLDESGERALLCVNHEYATTKLMFRDIANRSITKEECDVELAAHGGSVVEIVRTETGQWETVLSSPYNRRITGGFTPMAFTGPAAGSDRLKTSDDPSGRMVDGTLNNCAGGMTPWGTYLMAEENFNGVFTGELDDSHAEAFIVLAPLIPTTGHAVPRMVFCFG